jgi:hypothetical protein
MHKNVSILISQRPLNNIIFNINQAPFYVDLYQNLCMQYINSALHSRGTRDELLFDKLLDSQVESGSDPNKQNPTFMLESNKIQRFIHF